ncbi:prephenate dehydratase [Rhodosporidiobolus nylandii]
MASTTSAAAATNGASPAPRVAFLGPLGTYSHQAATDFFDVFTAVSSSSATYGLVPIENSSFGPVAETTEQLRTTELSVRGMIALRIGHALLSSKEASGETEKVKRVYSHEQGIGQCATYLSTRYPSAEIVPVASTALAAQHAQSDPEALAICSEKCAEVYDLKVVDRNIQDAGVAAMSRAPSAFTPSDPSTSSARPTAARKRKPRRSELDPALADVAPGESYAPAARQLKRKKRTKDRTDGAGKKGKERSEEKERRRERKKERRRREKGKGRAVEEDEGQAGGAAPQKQKKPRPRKALKPALSQSQAGAGAGESSKATRGQRKKRVRIAAPEGAGNSGDDERGGRAGAEDSDDEDGDFLPPGSRGGDADLAALARTGGADDEDVDLADPASIPLNPSRYTARYWRSLEYGGYRTALHDVARERAELGRVLVEWEGIRRKRAAEEEAEKRREQDEQDGPEAGEGEEQPAEQENEGKGKQRERQEDSSDDGDNYEPSDAEGGGAKGKGQKKKPAAPRAKPRETTTSIARRLRSHDPTRSLTPFPLPLASTSAAASPTPTSPALHALEVDPDTGAQILPLPSSVALAKMARWPLHPSSLPAREDEESLEDSLREVMEYQQERVAAERTREEAGAPREKGRKRARSAYGPGGPFANWGGEAPPSPSSSSSTSSDSDSELPLPASAEEAIAAIPSLLSRLSLRLLDFLPKSPLPAYDMWSAITREGYIRAQDEKRGVRRDERSPGWEEVLAVAREGGVEERVLNELEQQLVSVFGPSTRSPVNLPPAGGEPYIPIPPSRSSKPKKRRTRDALDAEDGLETGGAAKKKKKGKKRARSPSAAAADSDGEGGASEGEQDERPRKRGKKSASVIAEAQGRTRRRVVSKATIDSDEEDEDAGAEAGGGMYGFPPPPPAASYDPSSTAFPPPPPTASGSTDPATTATFASTSGQAYTPAAEDEMQLPTPPAQFFASTSTSTSAAASGSGTGAGM